MGNSVEQYIYILIKNDEVFATYMSVIIEIIYKSWAIINAQNPQYIKVINPAYLSVNNTGYYLFHTF